MKRILGFILIAVLASGSDTRVEAPVLGYAFDANALAVRAVVGIPGASRLSEARTGPLQKAWLAPGKHHGLGLDPEGRLQWIDFANSTSRAIDVPAPERVSWSPSGETAALLYADGRIRVLAGDTSLELTPVALEVSAFAVSDDGLVLAITRTSELHSITRDNDTLLLSAPGLTAVAFFRGRDAVVAGDGKIYLLKDAVDLKLLGDAAQTSAVAVTEDGSHVLAASRERRTITTIRLSGGISAKNECGCTPETVDRLQRGVFRITGIGDGPMWLFNADTPETPFVFVPQPETANE